MLTNFLHLLNYAWVKMMLNVRHKTNYSPAVFQVPGHCPLSEQTLRHFFLAKLGGTV